MDRPKGENASLRGQRQDNREGGALIQLTPDVNITPMGPGDRMGYTQAQSESRFRRFPSTFGPEKFIKYFLHIFFGNPFPRVTDINMDMIFFPAYRQTNPTMRRGIFNGVV